jgi:predicted ATP-grasp superfamily ATP-dependent carboligase
MQSMVDTRPETDIRGVCHAGHRGRRAGAIIIGGDYRGLGIARSLGRHDIPLWVLKDDHALAAASRYVRHSHPWPAVDEARQVEFLLDLATRHHLAGWTLYPTGDETAALVARHHAVLGARFRLTTPPWEVLCWAYDKRLTYHLAAQLGIDAPWTRYPRNRQEVEALACTFPIILKPAIKASLNRFTAAKAWPVTSREALLARYDEACTLVAPDVIMVQELIPGGGETQFSYAALCVEGQPVASLVARRSRQYPLDFGHASTYVETVDQPEIEEPSRRLLAALRYTGLVEVEFKRDPRHGTYKLLDINPRVWGWHTLGHRAGVDFPYLLWRLVHGEEVPTLRGRTGVRWVRTMTDLAALAAAVRHGTFSPRGYLHSLRGPLELAIFAFDDPLPALVELPQSSHLLWRRLRDQQGRGR